ISLGAGMGAFYTSKALGAMLTCIELPGRYAAMPFGALTSRHPGLQFAYSAMKKETVSRFSISLAPSLLAQLDSMTREKGYGNRSQAIADMIRAQLVEHRQKTSRGEIAGTITLVYDHHKPHVQATLTDIQHDHHQVIISTIHVQDRKSVV